MPKRTGFIGKAPVYYVYRKHNKALAWKGTLTNGLDKLKQAFPSDQYFILKDNKQRLVNPYVSVHKKGKLVIQKRSKKPARVTVKQRKKK